MDFTEANEKLGKRDSRKIGNHTYLQRRVGPVDSIAVRFHKTDVVTFYPNGNTMYDSGGWRTVTTKERMNAFGNAWIYSERGIWYLSLSCPYPVQKSVVYVFQDCITVRADGIVTGQGPDPKPALKLRKQVQSYALAFVEALRNGKVPAPSAGDCWFCCLKAQDGKPMGEAVSDNSHLISHVKERYFVPSLLTRALEVMPSSQMMRWAVQSAFSKSSPEDFNPPGLDIMRKMSGGNPLFHPFVWKDISKCLSRYMLRQLGQQA